MRINITEAEYKAIDWAIDQIGSIIMSGPSDDYEAAASVVIDKLNNVKNKYRNAKRK